MNPRKTTLIPYIMWLLPLLFFTYQFILRLFPGLIMQKISIKFAIDATDFGLLGSVYYYGYAGMQIPIAILLDSYKSKYVIFTGIIICAISTLIFSITDNWYIVLCSRFLVGAGSAVAFLGVSKVVSIWFAPASYSRIIGLSFTIGLCGAIYGGRPTNMLIENMGWQKVSIILAIVAFVISALVLLFLQDKQVMQVSDREDKININDFKYVLSNPTIWLLAISNFLMVGTLEGFADIWAVNYLITAYHMQKSTAAELASFIPIGMLFGGPLLAALAKKYNDYNILICCGIFMSIIFCILLLLKIEFNYVLLAVLFWFLGLLCCYQVVVLSAGASTLTNLRFLGITIAFLNSINMLGGSFFHSIIGLMMDKFWNGSLIEGVKQYDLPSYNLALMVVPICAFIGSILILVIKLVHSRQVHNNSLPPSQTPQARVL